ncbi:MAG: hypothetical protein LUI12_01910 [Clostridiales bacterium]|nr:hypothetical protein [Clostridiales bacterium]
MTYQAIYKCRLCGEITCGAWEGERREAANSMNWLTNDRDYSNCYTGNIERMITHYCDDGSIGIADFQGFKVVEE